MLRKTQSNRSIDILSRLLAEENLDITHDSNAVTACWYPALRKLVLPTYGNQISTNSQIGFSLHETGHATDSPDDEELRRLFKTYGRAVVNILEDVRIEKIVKAKYAGASKYFVKMYDELVIEHDFFGTANQNNPFDFSAMNFLSRVNCHFKVGAKAMVPFNPSEQKLVDEIAEIETIADLEVIAKVLKEIAKENAKKEQEEAPPSPFTPESDEDGEESDNESEESGDDSDDEGEESESDEDFTPETDENDINADPESDDEGEESDYSEDGSGDFESDSDDGEGPDSDDDEESDGIEIDEDDLEGEESDGSGSEFDDDSDDDATSSGGTDSDDSDDEGEESESDDETEEGGESPDGEDGDEGNSPDADEPSDADEGSDNTNSNDDDPQNDPDEIVDIEEDDLEESDVLDHSTKALEELARNAGKVGRIPRTKDMDNKVQPWKDIEVWVDDMISGEKSSHDNYRGRDSYYNISHLNIFRKEIKSLVNKMVSEFNRNAAGSVSRRTAYKDTGILDPMKMIHYKYNENIFKKRKFVRDGKNHGVVLFVDLTGSMRGRITDIMRQVLLMTEFCRKINLPYRVYGWSNTYLPSTSGDYADIPFSYTSRGATFENVGITELLTSDMPKAVYEKYARFFLRNNYEILVGGSTPLVSAMYYAMPAIDKFRKEAGAEIVKMMMFTDGSGHTSLEDWGSDSWIDEETGKQYSLRELNDDFNASDREIYDYPDRRDAQQYFVAKVLKDRYDVSTVFIYMNRIKEINKKARSSGMWSKKDIRRIKKVLKEGAPVVEFGERGNCYTYVAIKDGYRIATDTFKMEIPEGSTDREIKKAFLQSNKLRKSSTLFATVTAKAIATQ